MENDLISREALKKAFAEYGEKAKFTQGSCQQLIDNAPTELQVTVFAENASKEEIEDFKQELENVLKRPRGEWLKSDIPESVLAKCSLCGFNCGAYTYNFCPNCGADMRGKENAKT